MIADSKKHLLNLGQIALLHTKDNLNGHPLHAALAGSLAELNHPGVKTKQFGNTIFIVIIGTDNTAFFRIMNVDTSVNFIANCKLFLHYAADVLKLKILVAQYVDPNMERALKIIFERPEIPGMSYKLHRLNGGNTQMDIYLGSQPWAA